MNEDIERLVRLETKLDVVLENQHFFRASFDKHDERIKQLENGRSHTIGYAAAVGTAIGLFLDNMKHLILR
jgi:hypothetical protein